MSNKKQLPAFLALTIICVVAALALAGTNAITEGPIKEHAMAAQREAFGAVMTAEEYIEMTIPEGSGVSALVEAKQDGKTIGYCVAASSGGYAGPVAVTLGVGTDGKVTGAKIGDTSFAETSGFGSRWLAENQTEQFVGIDLKEGGAIEALSGATLTSNAVLNASNTALSTVSSILGIERTEPVLVFGVAEKKPVEQMTLTGDIHEGSAKGFASDVRVQLTMDASGAITGLAIESSGETSGFGTRCMEDPTFAEQFIGKTAPFAIGQNIDALAGASVTSGAVVNAVNAAVESPANPDAVPFGAGSEEPAVEVSAEPLPEGALTASAKGLMSDVKVTITLNEDGTIATMTVDCSGETAAIAAPCAEEAFLSQFVGKKGPFENIEVVSGATFTSNAVINAVNSLFAEEEGLTASAEGLMSDVKVTITLNEDGTIATMAVDCSGETAAIAAPCAEDAFLSQFIGKKGPFENAEVVSGATFTSNAVITAVNSLFPAEEAPAADALTASAEGLMSDVKVTITLNADGTIATMVVDCSGETQAIAAPCAEDAFLSQFIGKKGPFENAEVVSGATYTSNAVITAVNSLFAAEEAPAGETLTASAMGFESKVTVKATVDENGKITALVIDASDETEGLGTRCMSDAAFIEQFIGKTAPFTVGENVNALSGATYTSKAVAEALNSLFAAKEEAPAADTLTASAEGLMSDVKVTITLNEDGTIATMTVDCSGETQAIAAPCAEDAFLSQFIGKKGPFENAEVVSGATYTSNAVITAVNSLFPAEEAPAADTLSASAEGLMSDVKVTITLNADGTIATMAVDCSGETQAIAAPCAEDAFLSQFIGKKGPFENAEVVSGATYTSKAVITAVNSLFPAEEAPAADTLTASAEGLMSDVKVTITLNADGTIATMTVDCSGETQAIAAPCAEDAFLSQFIGKKGPFENAEVVSGATYTSKAVITAVNSLFPAETAAPVGETLTASAMGFESKVTVKATVDENGKITALVIDAADETEGLGTRCMSDAAFIEQFIGKTAPFTVGENVNALSGATYTSKAVAEALNSLFAAKEEAPAADTLTASAEGLMSDVKVTITLNADGTIATMTVDCSGETQAIAAPCAEDAFLSQFIGKKGPFENAEVVSGATYTSKAVITAVNSLFPAEEAPAGETLTASAMGFESKVTVKATVDENGVITALVIDAADETEGLGTRCMSDAAFIEQFIGKTAPFTVGENVNALSGATYTSKAVAEALNSLFAAKEEAPAADTLTASAEGLMSDVKVTITLNADGTIATMAVDCSGETQAIAAPCAEDAFLSQFIGKKGPFANAEVVSGATYTSNAVITAVNSLFPAE